MLGELKGTDSSCSFTEDSLGITMKWHQMVELGPSAYTLLV